MLRPQWLSLIAASTMSLVVVAFSTISGERSDTLQAPPEFPQPKVRRSSHGVLFTALQAFIAHNRIQDPATGETRDVLSPTYDGTIPGATLRVKPGDTMYLLLVNGFPANPQQDRMGAFPHHPYTTNLHTHGLTVSPQGNSDNVLREMEPGTSNLIRIKIPTYHQSGTFWYHPHKHGAVSFQFFGGMSGFLIVEGGPETLDAVPEVKAAREVVMAFQAIRTDQSGRVPFVNAAAAQLGTDGQNAGLWSA